MIVRFPLSVGRMAAVKIPPDLTIQEFERFVAVLRLCLIPTPQETP